MSWALGAVRIGFGSTPGNGEVLFFEDPSPIDIRHVAVASGFRFPALWEFDQHTGNLFFVLQQKPNNEVKPKYGGSGCHVF